MQRILILAVIFLLPVCAGVALAAPAPETEPSSIDSRAFVPGPGVNTGFEPAPATNASPDAGTQVAALWPFGGGSDTPDVVKPKSARKAFFLSLLLPGLGEYYVGSKRGLIFLGVEALGWWMYASYTGKGNDIEKDFESFADANWRYSAPAGEYSYVEWFADKLRDKGISDAQLPRTYQELAGTSLMDSLTDALMDKGEMLVSHTLPSTKVQQYYEMIGKYPQFVYGWKDITANNTSLVDSLGMPKGNYDESIRNIKSSMREHYETLRDDSNKNLKMGQNGVNLLIVNRVVSAIDAARLAYHHNKGLESELSMIRINIIQKQIIDHRVPMLVVSRIF
ncbi:MAG: hypothetical protein ACYC9O_04315 [Candidatus Latescibacterota bacterium]